MIRTDTRLVVVDVVVRDKNDQPVKGLKATDFTVFEDGKPQLLKAFETHPSPAQIILPSPIKMAPHQYTNVPAQNVDLPLSIIVLDTLNTPISNQAYGRQQLVQFLKTLPRGRPVALFALGTRLRMIQGFTGSSDDLLAAAAKLLPKSSPLLDTEADRQRSEDELANLQNAMPRGGAETAERLREFLDVQEAFRMDIRIETTLNGLDELARSMAGYPGRKNLIWLSGGFPFSLGPNTEVADPFRNQRDYSTKIRQTSARLAAAQVAVYPIDIRGLMTMGVDIASSGAGSMGMNSGGYSRYGMMLDRQQQEVLRTHGAMKEIAEQTGGEAFYNTNDLRNAMVRTIDHTTSYYTVAYAPGNRHWDRTFRKISVKVARPDLKLEYRRGYYALPDEQQSDKDRLRMLATAIQPGAPNSTSLLFLAQVAPSADGNKINIDYGLDARQFTFTDTPTGRKHAVIDLIAVAWDKNGKDAAHLIDTLDAALLPETYNRVMRTGIPVHRELSLKPGNYDLRIGVMDRTTQNIGTIGIPLAVPKQEN